VAPLISIIVIVAQTHFQSSENSVWKQMHQKTNRNNTKMQQTKNIQQSKCQNRGIKNKRNQNAK